VRITAQLINSTTGFQLWSQTYDRSIRDTLTVQAEIANSVAHALKITLLGGVSGRAGEGGTHDERALDAYLRSLKLAVATVRSAEEARATIAACTEALRIDPNFALAYSARARAELIYAGYFFNEATRATFARARADAERAVAIAPELGETHSALGETLEIGFLDFRRAADEHARALTLAPGSAQVLRAYSRFMAYMGHPDAAIAAARRNAALDPLNVLAFGVLGEALQAARRYADAIVAYDQAIRLNPGHASEVYQHRGRSEYLLGNFEMAKASCEVEPDQYHVQLCMPLVYEKLGEHAAAEAVLATAMAAQGDAAAYQYAQIYAQWGDTGKALDWLEKALRLRDPGIEYLKTDQLLDPLRTQPRFQAIERALRFAT
jgi:tetratricopeptide (TPR) repeat protein